MRARVVRAPVDQSAETVRADLRRRRAALAAEVARLAADDQDRAARAELMADMDAIATDWPE